MSKISADEFDKVDSNSGAKKEVKAQVNETKKVIALQESDLLNQGKVLADKFDTEPIKQQKADNATQPKDQTQVQLQEG